MTEDNIVPFSDPAASLSADDVTPEEGLVLLQLFMSIPSKTDRQKVIDLVEHFAKGLKAEGS